MPHAEASGPGSATPREAEPLVSADRAPAESSMASPLGALYTYISWGSAIMVSVGSVYGYVFTEDAHSALIPCGLAFTGLFVLASERKARHARPPYQALLILVLIACSFCVHLLYLPAGIFCFFCLMAAQSDLLYTGPPPIPVERKER